MRTFIVAPYLDFSPVLRVFELKFFFCGGQDLILVSMPANVLRDMAWYGLVGWCYVHVRVSETVIPGGSRAFA